MRSLDSSPDAGLAALADDIAALPRPLVLALDVDGTLAPIVDDPTRAKVPSSTARRLRRLRAAPDVELALVTGRDAGQLERMLSLPGAWRVVEHGRRIIPPGRTPRAPSPPAERRRQLGAFRSWAREIASPAGAIVEDKDASVVVHVRRLAKEDPEAAEQILAAARRAARESGLWVRDGRAVVEAQLEAADKGSALERLLDQAGGRSCAYLGDDLTDQPAIALASERGVGIFVRSAERPEPPGPSSATVEGPAEVARLIELLEERLRS